MDETAYRQVRSEVIARPCAFEKALLARCAACRRSGRIQIAEREAVTCLHAPSQQRCTTLHDSLRHNFSFALGRPPADSQLPHAQEMRIQCGGLQGTQFVLKGEAAVIDVDLLLDDVLLRWGDIADMPYSEIVHAAALCYKGRHG